MDVLYILVPLGVIVAIASGIAFWAAAQGGQFDDLEQSARAILHAEPPE